MTASNDILEGQRTYETVSGAVPVPEVTLLDILGL